MPINELKQSMILSLINTFSLILAQLPKFSIYSCLSVHKSLLYLGILQYFIRLH